MARFRLCRSCGDIHQLGRWPHNCREPAPPRSDFPAPHIISDNLPGGVNGLYHHAAECKIDSKSAYRAATRRHGCIEMGNEFATATRAREERDIQDAVIESAINDALHEHGISSESDTGKLDYGA